MEDQVTILISKDHLCTKQFVLQDDCTVEVNVKHSYLYDYEERPVSSLTDLAKCLESLEGSPQAAVIRGKAREGITTTDIRRTKENFGPASRQWCLIDIDDVPIPEEFADWKSHLTDLIDTAIRQLPTEFQGVDCWYQFSSSMGIKKGKIRIHLWFWLSRKVADDEMKAWLSNYPIDLHLYNPVQLHYVAQPIFLNDALDPLLRNRSGILRMGEGIDSVPVPTDLDQRSVEYARRPRHIRAGGFVENQGIVRSETTGLAIDGRERLLFDLSNEVTTQLVQPKRKVPLTLDELTDRLWERFQEEADLTDGKWTKIEAEKKAAARLKELEEGTHRFTSRNDATTLLPAVGPYYDLELVTAEEGQGRLEELLDRFFSAVGEGDLPRQVIKITMGAGKTTQAIKKLKTFLKSRKNCLVEIYVPRHDIADEYESKIADGEVINATVVHVRPRTGEDKSPLCRRSEYVRELEKAGVSVYSSACRSGDGTLCNYFSECEYLSQFRQPTLEMYDGNVVRIYQHTQLGLPRNPFEEDSQPDLVIVDENFLQSLIVTDDCIHLEALREHLKATDAPSLGDLVANALRDSQPVLEALKGIKIRWQDLNEIDLEYHRPKVPFDAKSDRPKPVVSAKTYNALRMVKAILMREWFVPDHENIEGLSYDPDKGEVRVCYVKDARITENTPLLLLDATADQMLVEKVFGPVRFDQIDIEQRAFVTQVYDHTASNTWWSKNAVRVDELVQVLNAWVEYGETPLLVSHKKLAEQLEERVDLSDKVQVMNFGGLRGSNEAEKCSVVFITGRNQPQPREVDLKGRALFWDQTPLQHDDPSVNLHQEMRGYFHSANNALGQSGVLVRSFSDPRIEAIHSQIREAETVQAIARLRLVHSKYRKRVFLLGNLPVEIPVDRLVTLDELMPDRLEKELLARRNLPLTAQGIVNLRPDITDKVDNARKMLKRSAVTDPKSLAKVLPELVRATVLVARFEAGKIRKTPHEHIFLPAVSSSGEQAVVGRLQSTDEIRGFLKDGWGEIEDLELGFWFQPDKEVH